MMNFQRLLADLVIYPNFTYRLYFCGFYGSQNTQKLFPYIAFTFFYNGDGLCSLCGAEDVLQFMFIVFKNIGLHQYAYIEAWS